MELTIVMPCLNEAKTLPICLEKAFRFLRESGIDGEVIVADNGSDDGSVEIAQKMGARVVPVPVKGYGAALSEGIYQAQGEFLIMGDSDDSYDFLGLLPFVEKLREGYDLVMGNRFAGGISPGAMPFMHRFVGNPLLSALGRRIYEHEVCGDFYCGLRGFRKSSIQELRLQSTGMEFALEMLIKAELYRLKITEVPTTLSPDGRNRRPHLRTYRDGWKSLRLYLLMSPRWTFGLPGVALGIVGLIALAAFLVLPSSSALAAPYLFLAMSGIILGYQAVLLAIFAKFVAIESGLHPPPTKFAVLQENGTLERFALAGAGMAILGAVVGILAGIFAGTPWLPFLRPLSLKELFFLGGIFFILGIQTIMAGFYFGFLGMLSGRRQFRRKRKEDMTGDARPPEAQ
jgi:glycosyltransferase involved in cell wall biosynthesis